jgi:hypothetical protein
MLSNLVVSLTENRHGNQALSCLRFVLRVFQSPMFSSCASQPYCSLNTGPPTGHFISRVLSFGGCDVPKLTTWIIAYYEDLLHFSRVFQNSELILFLK